MQMHGDATLVWLILVPLFLGVGLWLLIYSHRCSRRLKGFAQKHGLAYRPKDEGGLEAKLSRAFRLKPPYGRAFFRIRDIVSDTKVTIARLTEALDLSRHGTPQSTHHARIAAFFRAREAADLYFRVTRDGKYVWSHPERDAPRNDRHFEAAFDAIASQPPPHPLSVTCMNGQGLVYLEPTLVGSEKEPELEYLLALARKLRHVLS
ncbi:MAG: hypothetical protein GWN84_17265 [Gammaproteobacteria bacterium]|nr:hypothetical protein [Gammaproteobacteria bacterium]NIR84588.1 hypothetical protein [Gammaproteobacteria bacterium]NIR90491.1 hypothetical protein [Gammaproteobacteria bacterium]NIU05639.1 hypothetical protein [Gammaproteobacteria bacterium]NIV52778.1 hypothetical protein [Gammaproteobacteria bacterium]